MIVTYAYLGAPRTTRQKPDLVARIGGRRRRGTAHDRLRQHGFGIKHPLALTFQYIAVALATGLGLMAISQGAIIEPPAFMVRAAAAITERLSRRFATTWARNMVAGTLSRYFGLRFLTQGCSSSSGSSRSSRSSTTSK